MLTLSGRVTETRQTLAKQFSFRLRTPDLIITVSSHDWLYIEITHDIVYMAILHECDLCCVIFSLLACMWCCAGQRAENQNQIPEPTALCAEERHIPGLKDWECSMSKLFTMGKTSIHLLWLSQTVFCNTNTYNFYIYNFEITFFFSYFQWYCRPSLNVSDRDSCSQTVRPTEVSSNTWLSSAHSGAWVANILVKDHWIIFTSLISANIYILKTLTTALWLQYLVWGQNVFGLIYEISMMLFEVHILVRLCL